jgi:hypothetical protein
MHSDQIALGIINAVGGILVIGSYVHGILNNPENRDQAWGGVPDKLRPLYTACMPLAAAGYFAFSYFILFRLDPSEARIADAIGFDFFYPVYVLILFPSALWMPLTFAMLDRPSRARWWAIRSTLTIVGLASIALLVGLLLLSTETSGYAYWLAVAGAAVFSVQTAMLDAVVWPRYFPTVLPEKN